MEYLGLGEHLDLKGTQVHVENEPHKIGLSYEHIVPKNIVLHSDR
jgi:hypothetical protein